MIWSGTPPSRFLSRLGAPASFAPLASANARFRRSGADLPFGDPSGYHGTALEGYFWRITLPRSRAIVIVMASINRDVTGAQWGTVALAAHPGGLVHATVADVARGTPRGIGIHIANAGHTMLEASSNHLIVNLGPGLCLNARFEDQVMWRRRVFGGIGIAQLIPGLSQYWHPHMLSSRTTGSATLAGRELNLDAATTYAEKNWGRYGFPTDWWWGQAHGFDRPDVCAAFAGGIVGKGPRSMKATALVVRVGSTIITAASPLEPVRTRLDDGRWSVSARTVRHSIQIDGHANGSHPYALPVPVANEHRNEPRAAMEHLAADMHVSVRKGRRTLFEGSSPLAGLERGHPPIPSNVR